MTKKRQRVEICLTIAGAAGASIAGNGYVGHSVQLVSSVVACVSVAIMRLLATFDGTIPPPNGG